MSVPNIKKHNTLQLNIRMSKSTILQAVGRIQLHHSNSDTLASTWRF